MNEQADPKSPESSPEPLAPLPDLDPIRETFCSRDTVNCVARYLMCAQPDQLQALLHEEWCGTFHERSEALWRLLDELAEEHSGAVELPSTLLGRLDLGFELRRRLRRANGLDDIHRRGRPLADRFDAALPPLARLAIALATAPCLAQQTVDGVLDAAYHSRPDLWYATAEEYRIDMRMLASCQLGQLLRNMLMRQHPSADTPDFESRASSQLYSETTRRINRMCALDGRPLAPGPDGPYPPLVEMEWYAQTRALGCSLRMITTMLQKSYRSRPDLWYHTGEFTRGIGSSEPKEALRASIAAMLEEGFPQWNQQAVAGALFSEAYRRIHQMCGMNE